jgi:hypothetical protein
VEAGEIEEKRFRQWVEDTLTRREDRALFGLPARAETGPG